MLDGPIPGVLDISAIPVTPPTDTLTAQFVINAPTNDPWANGLQPFAELSFIGDPPQVCFQTTVAKICSDRLDQRPGQRHHQRHPPAGPLQPDHLAGPTRCRRAAPPP